MKKVFSILILGVCILSASLFFSACEKCDSKGTKLKINSISARFAKIIGVVKYEDSLNYFDTKEISIDTIGVHYDSLGIMLLNEIQSYTKNTGINFINKAYACDPVFEFKGIDSVYIYSDADYNTQHPAGTNLREIMGFRSNTLVANESEKNVQGSLAFLNFIASPSQSVFHTLTIKYKLVDGKLVSYTLPRVKILK